MRELRNIVERMLVLHGRSDVLLPEFLPEEFCHPTPRSPAPPLAGVQPARQLGEAVRSYERQLIEHALEEANGVQTAAARKLGTTRRILKYRMEK